MPGLIGSCPTYLRLELFSTFHLSELQPSSVSVLFLQLAWLQIRLAVMHVLESVLINKMAALTFCHRASVVSVLKWGYSVVYFPCVYGSLCCYSKQIILTKCGEEFLWLTKLLLFFRKISRTATWDYFYCFVLCYESCSPVRPQILAVLSDGQVIPLVELSAKQVAFHIPFEVVEKVYPPVPEQLQLRIAYWSFPENEEDIRWEWGGSQVRMRHPSLLG